MFKDDRPFQFGSSSDDKAGGGGGGFFKRPKQKLFGNGKKKTEESNGLSFGFFKNSKPSKNTFSFKGTKVPSTGGFRIKTSSSSKLNFGGGKSFGGKPFNFAKKSAPPTGFLGGTTSSPKTPPKTPPRFSVSPPKKNMFGKDFDTPSISPGRIRRKEPGKDVEMSDSDPVEKDDSDVEMKDEHQPVVEMEDMMEIDRPKPRKKKKKKKPLLIQPFKKPSPVTPKKQIVRFERPKMNKPMFKGPREHKPIERRTPPINSNQFNQFGSDLQRTAERQNKEIMLIKRDLEAKVESEPQIINQINGMNSEMERFLDEMKNIEVEIVKKNNRILMMNNPKRRMEMDRVRAKFSHLSYD